MRLDPHVDALLQQLEAMGQPPLHELPVEEARQVAAMLATLDGEPEPVGAVADRTIDGVAVRTYQPTEANGPLPVVAWFHAGGGVVGDLETADRTCRRLANRSGALVVSVDYRRAPEHRFPAAVDDCWAVTRWLGDHAGELGGDPARLAVGGDSMGATFAAVVALRAARAGAPGLRHQLLVYPMTDLTLGHPSVEECAEGYLVTKDLCAWFADTYLGPDGDPRHPDASPLHADDLGGVAPATVVVAHFDPSRDEALAYAARLRDAGVPVDLQVYDGMIHVFFALSGVVEVANEAMDRCATALREALNLR